jgi:hypothetical protein
MKGELTYGNFVAIDGIIRNQLDNSTIGLYSYHRPLLMLVVALSRQRINFTLVFIFAVKIVTRHLFRYSARNFFYYLNIQQTLLFHQRVFTQSYLIVYSVNTFIVQGFEK